MNVSDSDTQPRFATRISPAQVIALGLIAASIGWAAWLLRDRPTSEEVELLPGTVLPSSELAIVEAAFDRAQLSGHRTEDGRIWVPRPRQSAYMRALVDAEALPREFGSSLRRALEQNSPWQSRAVQEEMLRVAVQEELSHVICSMPGIERAAVLYDVDERSSPDGGLGGSPTRTASVNVRTQPDAELEPARVQAIRVLVAASIAGLTPERVAVTDLRSGRVHAGPLDVAESSDPAAAIDPDLARRIAHERHLAMKVRQGIGFVKGAIVDVSVSFADGTEASMVEPGLPPRQQRVADANAPAEVTVGDVPPSTPHPAPPRREGPASIVVSLAVPDTWFEMAVRAARGRDPAAAVAAIERREEDRLRDLVLQLLPTAPRPDAHRVVLTRFPAATPRAESRAGLPVTAPAATAATRIKPKTIGEFVDATIQAVSAGDFAAVPREAWMVLTAKCSAILAYILFRGGSRGDSPATRETADGPRRNATGIDWSSLEHAPAADDEREPPSRRRMAA